jgi:hypothetical protein
LATVVATAAAGFADAVALSCASQAASMPLTLSTCVPAGRLRTPWTGGTVAACVRLLRQAGATPVGVCVVAELQGLDGRARLAGLPVHALVPYEGA